jgi:hypothetical protein
MIPACSRLGQSNPATERDEYRETFGLRHFRLALAMPISEPGRITIVTRWQGRMVTTQHPTTGMA